MLRVWLLQFYENQVSFLAVTLSDRLHKKLFCNRPRGESDREVKFARLSFDHEIFIRIFLDNFATFSGNFDVKY